MGRYKIIRVGSYSSEVGSCSYPGLALTSLKSSLEEAEEYFKNTQKLPSRALDTIFKNLYNINVAKRKTSFAFSFSSVFERAKEMQKQIAKWLKKGYEFTWEEMVTDLLGKHPQVKDVAKRAAKVLRGAFRMKKADWAGYAWSAVEVQYIASLIEFETKFVEEHIQMVVEVEVVKAVEIIEAK